MSKYLKYFSIITLFLTGLILVACQQQKPQTKERQRKQRPKDAMSRCTYHLLVDLLSSAVSTRQTDRQDQLANNRLCLTVFLDDMGPFSFC
ncbi:TPA: hypothetical protein ACJQE4_000783 [Streptococcus pyogenes]